MVKNKLTSHPEFFKALSCLDKLDDDLASARKTYGNPLDRFEPATFPSLVRIILGQQISRQVAKVLAAAPPKMDGRKQIPLPV